MYQYLQDFTLLFQFDEHGAFIMTPPVLEAVEQWFNETKGFISVVSGVPVQDVSFSSDNQDQKRRLMMHVYSLAYVALARASTIVNHELPVQHRRMQRKLERP